MFRCFYITLPSKKVMIYSNENVRRRDRLLSEERALQLLEEGEYGILSMVNDENEGAYGIPISFVWDRGDYIYLHCAPQGHKLRCIARHPRVSFCVVGKTNVLSSKFTTEYESIVIDCTASIGLTAEERMNALHLLLQKYSPNDIDMGMTYAEKPNTYPAYPRTVLPAWGWGNPTYTFTLDMPLEDIKSIVLDPENKSVDTDKENNSFSK